MRFKLVKTGKTYAEPRDDLIEIAPDPTETAGQTRSFQNNPDVEINLIEKQPTIWKGTVDEYQAMLVWRQAELILAKAQITGSVQVDWYVNNRITDLEIKIADLKKWLGEK